MDGRKPPISLSDADAVRTDSIRESSSVIYFGSARQISEGFVVALRALGFEAGILSSDIAQFDATSNPEDS